MDLGILCSLLFIQATVVVHHGLMGNFLNSYVACLSSSFVSAFTDMQLYLMTSTFNPLVFTTSG